MTTRRLGTQGRQAEVDSDIRIVSLPCSVYTLPNTFLEYKDYNRVICGGDGLKCRKYIDLRIRGTRGTGKFWRRRGSRAQPSAPVLAPTTDEHRMPRTAVLIRRLLSFTFATFLLLWTQGGWMEGRGGGGRATTSGRETAPTREPSSSDTDLALAVVRDQPGADLPNTLPVRNKVRRSQRRRRSGQKSKVRQPSKGRTRLAEKEAPPADSAAHSPPVAPKRRPKSSACKFPNIAVAVKTGRLVAWRLPAILETWAADLCSLIIVTAFDSPEFDSAGPHGEGLNATMRDTDDAPDAKIGTGKRDFVVELPFWDTKWRALDVAGNLYPDENSPSIPLNILHKDRWAPGRYESLEDEAVVRLDTFNEFIEAEKQKNEGGEEAKGPTPEGAEASQDNATIEEQSSSNEEVIVDQSASTAAHRKHERRRLRKRGFGGSADGHSRDHEKNIPALAELWNRFPDASWYILVDDDTYISMPMLAEHLSKWDPAEPKYIGKAFMFTGCNIVDPDKFNLFATGIIYSRGAMLSTLPFARLAIEKTRGSRCSLGDARAAVLAAEAGIKMEWPNDMERRMHIEHQKEWHTFHRACDSILSYHLMPANLTRRLWETEQLGGAVTYADLWHLLPPKDRKVEQLEQLEGGFKENFNAGGMDILRLSPSPDDVAMEDFAAGSVALLRSIASSTKPSERPDWIPRTLPARLNRLALKANTTREKQAALALRCMQACTSLPSPTLLPPLPSRIPLFQNRTATSIEPNNKSGIFGPCIVWSIGPEGVCFLKSGMLEPLEKKVEEHWSGFIKGARKRYEDVGRDGAGGVKCGWNV